MSKNTDRENFIADLDRAKRDLKDYAKEEGLSESEYRAQYLKLAKLDLIAGKLDIICLNVLLSLYELGGNNFSLIHSLNDELESLVAFMRGTRDGIHSGIINKIENKAKGADE